MSGAVVSTDLKRILKTIGDRLKEAREARGLSVEQVQKETRFHHSIVNALEEGTGQDKMDSLYLKSYLRKYSKFLGLNEQELLSEFTGFHAPPSQQNIEIKSIDKLDETGKALKFYLPRIGLGLAVIAVAFGLIFAFGKGVIFLKNKMADARQSAAASGKQAPAVRERKTPNFIPISIPKKDPLRLAIDVSRPVLLMAARDGEILFTNVLRAGTRETVIAKSKITLWVKEASAIEITLNGEYFGSPGRGEIKELEITHKGIRIAK
ncbi:helix-turn-helix domain-containing protein [Candidatus Omnitrophota bacterium]